MILRHSVIEADSDTGVVLSGLSSAFAGSEKASSAGSAKISLFIVLFLDVCIAKFNIIDIFLRG